MRLKFTNPVPLRRQHADPSLRTATAIAKENVRQLAMIRSGTG